MSATAIYTTPDGIRDHIALEKTSRGWYWFSPNGQDTGVGAKSKADAITVAKRKFKGFIMGNPDRSAATLFGASEGGVRAGDRVSFVDRFGKTRTGRAVMRGPHGWVLNMGGRHGTPEVVADSDITKVSKGRRNPKTDPVSGLPTMDLEGTALMQGVLRKTRGGGIGLREVTLMDRHARDAARARTSRTPPSSTEMNAAFGRALAYLSGELGKLSLADKKQLRGVFFRAYRSTASNPRLPPTGYKIVFPDGGFQWFPSAEQFVKYLDRVPRGGLEGAHLIDEFGYRHDVTEWLEDYKEGTGDLYEEVNFPKPKAGNPGGGRDVSVGDRVKYSAHFLRSIGVYSGPMAHAVGKVNQVVGSGPGLTLAYVDWGGADLPDRVNVNNLVRVQDLPFEPNPQIPASSRLLHRQEIDRSAAVATVGSLRRLPPINGMRVASIMDDKVTYLAFRPEGYFLETYTDTPVPGRVLNPEGDGYLLEVGSGVKRFYRGRTGTSLQKAIDSGVAELNRPGAVHRLMTGDYGPPVHTFAITDSVSARTTHYDERGVPTRYNPEGEAADLYEEFHGKPADRVTEISGDMHVHAYLAELGDLVEMKVSTLSNLDLTLGFDKASPKLASSEDGTTLYIEGGDQSLDLKSIKMDGDKWIKDSMVIGVIREMTYRTEKSFDKFESTDYFHKLGEETGVQPLLIYRPRDEKMEIMGGQYLVKSEGVVN